MHFLKEIEKNTLQIFYPCFSSGINIYVILINEQFGTIIYFF